jgi:hypothetical protein
MLVALPTPAQLPAPGTRPQLFGVRSNDTACKFSITRFPADCPKPRQFWGIDAEVSLGYVRTFAAQGWPAFAIANAPLGLTDLRKVYDRGKQPVYIEAGLEKICAFFPPTFVFDCWYRPYAAWRGRSGVPTTSLLIGSNSRTGEVPEITEPEDGGPKKFYRLRVNYVQTSAGRKWIASALVPGKGWRNFDKLPTSLGKDASGKTIDGMPYLAGGGESAYINRDGEVDSYLGKRVEWNNITIRNAKYRPFNDGKPDSNPTWKALCTNHKVLQGVVAIFISQVTNCNPTNHSWDSIYITRYPQLAQAQRRRMMADDPRFGGVTSENLWYPTVQEAETRALNYVDVADLRMADENGGIPKPKRSQVEFPFIGMIPIGQLHLVPEFASSYPPELYKEQARDYKLIVIMKFAIRPNSTYGDFVGLNYPGAEIAYQITELCPTAGRFLLNCGKSGTDNPAIINHLRQVPGVIDLKAIGR